MRNPVAHEVAVVVTGARPSEDSGKRKLFTETTSSVLVFENGAVIRLSASVSAGQLLFLANQESRREVVAQVRYKRTFSPTSCYVELEFTEPAPGFWGIEFPTTAEPVAPDPRQSGIFELVKEAEITEEISGEPPAAATPDEVELLKREVQGLREQLQSLLQPQPAVSSAPAVPSEPISSPSPVQVAVPASVPEPAPEQVRAVRMQLPTSDPAYNPAPPPENPNLKKPESTSGSDGNFQEEAIVSDPAQAESLIWSPALIAKERKVRARARIIRFGLLAALLVVSTAAASYMHWIPQPKFFSRLPGAHSMVAAAAPANANRSPLKPPVSNSRDSKPATLAPGSPAAVSPKEDASSKTEGSSTPTQNSSSARETPSTSIEQAASTAPDEPAEHSASAEKPAAAGSPSKRSQLRHPTDEASNPVAAPISEENAALIPPKLLQSVRPVSPPDAAHGFVTGNVKVDALVDPSGHVKSVSVLAGPDSLRNAAIEAVKQYKYAPATRNSAPVPAHVTLTVQFWYEP